MSPTQHEVEARIQKVEPRAEVLLVDVVGGDRLRVFIDHPDGVSLDLCERVTRVLDDLRDRHAIEVSSPGSQRPLTKPQHFSRFLGRRARIRTRHDLGPTPGRRSFTGELVGASDTEITIAAESGLIAIPFGEISRSNLVET